MLVAPTSSAPASLPYALVAVCLLCSGATDAIPRDVPCTFLPDSPTTCFVMTPLILRPDETVHFVAANQNVTRFELKAVTNLNRIPPSLWTAFPQLEEVVMADYAIVDTISLTDFYNAPKLRLLSLKNNKLTTIPALTFATVPTLEVLDLSANAIKVIEDLAFRSLANLRYLNLSHNIISELSTFTFNEAGNLAVLDLSYNKLKLVDPAALLLPNLRILDLNTNDLKVMPPLTSANLEYIDFGENKLAALDGTIYAMTALKFLNLTSNKKIGPINLPLLAQLPNLQVLSLSSSGIEFPTPLGPAAEPADDVTASVSPLKKLYLAKNHLINPDIFQQLRFFPQMELLNLEDNRFAFFTNVSALSTWFPSLHSIYVGDNKLDCLWLNASIPVFQASNINVFTTKKIKTWYGTIVQKKLIDTDDCFDLEKVFDKILFYINKFSSFM